MTALVLLFVVDRRVMVASSLVKRLLPQVALDSRGAAANRLVASHGILPPPVSTRTFGLASTATAGLPTADQSADEDASTSQAFGSRPAASRPGRFTPAPADADIYTNAHAE